MGTYRIVVGIDFDRTGDEALRSALQIGRGMPDAELHLVHIVDEPQRNPSAARLAEDARLLEDAGGRLQQYVRERITAEEGGGGPRKAVFHVRLGNPANALHQVAVDVDADLVVVGNHGDRGLTKLLLGSVAEKLVSIAKVPVLVARPKQFEGLAKSPRPDAPRPDQDDATLHAKSTWEHESVIDLPPRTSHIPGLV